jgi:hypothetical protein
MTPPEDQDVEPLDKQTDTSDDPIDPCNNTDNNPIGYPDEQFEAACIMFESEELFL